MVSYKCFEFTKDILPILLLSESFWNKWWRTTPLPGGVITLQGNIPIYILYNI